MRESDFKMIRIGLCIVSSTLTAELLSRLQTLLMCYFRLSCLFTASRLTAEPEMRTTEVSWRLTATSLSSPSTIGSACSASAWFLFTTILYDSLRPLIITRICSGWSVRLAKCHGFRKSVLCRTIHSLSINTCTVCGCSSFLKFISLFLCWFQARRERG